MEGYSEISSQIVKLIRLPGSQVDTKLSSNSEATRLQQSSFAAACLSK